MQYGKSIERNNPIKKWVEELNRHFSQRRHTDGQEAHEKMFNITNECWRECEKNPHILLTEMYIGTAILLDSMSIP